MKLVIFDVDGTLVDSQQLIFTSMGRGFDAAGLTPPARDRVLSRVGLSLDRAVSELAPAAGDDAHRRIVAGYRSAYAFGRLTQHPPLYPGARYCLARLPARGDLLLAIATGMSRRGVTAMIEAYGLEGVFVSQQTADDHPSKPAPDMILAALSDTGVAAAESVMIGDTEYDMQMARSAGVTAFGVTWGYHAAEALRAGGAAQVLPDFAALTDAIEEWAA